MLLPWALPKFVILIKSSYYHDQQHQQPLLYHRFMKPHVAENGSLNLLTVYLPASDFDIWFSLFNCGVMFNYLFHSIAYSPVTPVVFHFTTIGINQCQMLHLLPSVWCPINPFFSFRLGDWYDLLPSRHGCLPEKGYNWRVLSCRHLTQAKCWDCYSVCEHRLRWR